MLGPISVNGSVPGSPQERRLIAAFVANRGVPVSVDFLSDVLWHDEPPRSAANALQSKVSRLRSTVGADRLRRVGTGYLLDLAPDACDADRFDDLVRSAGGLSAEDGLATLDEALALWRGRAYDEFADDEFVRPAAVGLEQRRLAVHERRLELLLELRRHDDVLAATEELISADPYREAFWAARMRALARSGRAVDAVRTYQQARERFLDETGIPPSHALAALERAILAGEAGGVGAGMDAEAPGGDPAPEPVVVTDDRAARPPPARPSAPRPLGRPVHAELGGVALVERERARAALDAAVAGAGAGRPRLVLMCGPAGLGKTRLVDAACSAARAAGARVLIGRCVPRLHTPLGPLGQVMTALGRPRPPVVSAGPDRHELDPVDGDADAATTAAVLDLVADLATEPTVLVLEDLHWADAPTTAALELLLAEIESRAAAEPVPVLLVATHRPLDASMPSHAALDRLRRSPIATSIDLDPLSEAGVAAFVRAATGLRPTSGLAQRLVELTDGVPLLVGSLVDHWSRRGALVIDGGQVGLGPGAEGRAPADIDADILERHGALGDDAQRTLAVLALSTVADSAPPAVAAGVVAGVLHRETPSVLADIDACVAAGLLTRGALIRFTDPRVRSLVIEHTSLADRAALLAPLVVEVTGRPRVEGDLTLADMHPELAVHVLEEAMRAGVEPTDPAALARWARRATEDALAVGAWPAAAHHASIALDHASDEGPTLGDGMPLQLALGVAAFRDHDEHRAQEALLLAVERARAEGDARSEFAALGLLHRIAIAITDAGDLPVAVDNARARLEAWIADHTVDEPLLAARGCALLAEEGFARDDIESARADVERAQRIISSDDVAVVPAEVEFSAGLVALASLELRIAEQHFARSRDDALAQGDRWVASWGAGRLALVHLFAGDDARAERAIDTALDLQVPTRLWSEQALTRAFEASLAAARGDFTEAIAVAEESERLAVRSGYPWGRLIAVPVLAFARLALGEADAATAALDRLATDARPAPWPFVALVDAGAGRLEAAHERVVSRRHRLPEIPTLNKVPVIVATAVVAAATGDEALSADVDPLLFALHDRGVRRLPGWPVSLHPAITDLRASPAATRLSTPPSD